MGRAVSKKQQAISDEIRGRVEAMKRGKLPSETAKPSGDYTRRVPDRNKAKQIAVHLIVSIVDFHYTCNGDHLFTVACRDQPLLDAAIEEAYANP